MPNSKSATTQYDPSDLFDPPEIYTAQNGNRSIHIGKLFCNPSNMRKHVWSMKEYADTLLKLCDQLEAE
jgi:hypothetical protein